MNKTQKRVLTRFAPETQFELAPVPTVPFRGTREIEVEQLKQRLLRQLLTNSTNPELNAPFRRAANDAAALAWTTPYPLLVFPALLEEKAQAAQLQTLRQARIRQRSRSLLLEVV